LAPTSTLNQNLVQRARIVLVLNVGESPKEVAERLETSTPTVVKWRNRYIEQGLSGLQDAPRPGQPRKLDQKKVKSILDDTVKKTAQGIYSLERSVDGGICRCQLMASAPFLESG